MSMKFPIKPTAIEPVNFRFVAERLNDCATAVLWKKNYVISKCPHALYVLRFENWLENGSVNRNMSPRL